VPAGIYHHDFPHNQTRTRESCAEKNADDINHRTRKTEDVPDIVIIHQRSRTLQKSTLFANKIAHYLPITLQIQREETFKELDECMEIMIARFRNTSHEIMIAKFCSDFSNSSEILCLRFRLNRLSIE